MRKIYLLAFMALLTLCTIAQENSYKGSNKKWNQASNWTLNHVPTVTEIAIIPSDKTINLEENIASGPLKMKIYGTLSLGSRSITMAGEGAGLGIFTGGTLKGTTGSAIIINGTTSYSGANMNYESVGSNFYADINTNYQLMLGTLPVMLKDFTLIKNGKGVTIRWTTLQEINSAKFSIERSTDGLRWEVIASVNAKGNSTVETAYFTEDAHPVSGMNYYRIRSIDLDGSSTYSSTRKIRIGSLQVQLKVYPNPASSLLNVEIQSGNEGRIQALIINRLGQVVAQKSIQPNISRIEFNLDHLKEGDYVVHIKGENGFQETRTFVLTRK